MSVPVESSPTAPVKPPRWNFAGVCICCGILDCLDRRCATWHDSSTWMICPECAGTLELPGTQETCWACLFGVVEADHE